MSFPSTHDRSKHQDLLAIEFLLDEFHDTLFGIAHHRLARNVTVRIRHAGEKQTQQVVDLRDSANGAPWITADGLLLNSDHRTETADEINVRSLYATQKLTCVGIERLDIPSLSFGMDGIERQTALPASAQAGDHHQTIARYAYVDILQVMNACAEDLDVVYVANVRQANIRCCCGIQSERNT